MLKGGRLGSGPYSQCAEGVSLRTLHRRGRGNGSGTDAATNRSRVGNSGSSCAGDCPYDGISVLARLARQHPDTSAHTSCRELGGRGSPTPTAGSCTGTETRRRRDGQSILRRRSRACWSRRRQSCRSRWIPCGRAGSHAPEDRREGRGAGRCIHRACMHREWGWVQECTEGSG